MSDFCAVFKIKHFFGAPKGLLGYKNKRIGSRIKQ